MIEIQENVARIISEGIAKALGQGQGNIRSQPYQLRSNNNSQSSISGQVYNTSSLSTSRQALASGQKYNTGGSSMSCQVFDGSTVGRSSIQEVNHRLICYGCRNVGHMSWDCPKHRQNHNYQKLPPGPSVG